MDDIDIDPSIVYAGPLTDPTGIYFVVERIQGDAGIPLVGATASLEGRRWKILSINSDPTNPASRVRVKVEAA